MNPASGEVNYVVCAGNEAHIDAAVKSAHEAGRKPAWRNMLPHNRALILNRIADLMLERSDLLARSQMPENGKVLKECKNQVINGAATFRYCAAAIEILGSEITPSQGNYLNMTVYEPWGVVAAITPLNSPITLTYNKIAAAPAAGNGVVVKPSSYTPTSGIELGRIALDAGVPPGVVNVVPGAGGKIGDAQHGCGVDDGAAARLPHVRKRRPRQHPQPADIHIEGLVPLVFADLLRCSGVQHGSIVEQKVQAAKVARGLLEHGLNVSGPRYIRCHRQRRLAKLSLISSIRSWRPPTSTTRAPSRPIAAAQARPMALPAPVTMLEHFSYRYTLLSL